MTADEISALPTGADLDAAVAELVMGWRVCRGEYIRGGPWPCLFLPKGGAADGWVVRSASHLAGPWSPSTDVRAAFEVEEELFRGGLTDEYGGRLVSLIGRRLPDEGGHGRWSAKVTDIAHCPPDVRCRAALLAVFGRVELT